MERITLYWTLERAKLLACGKDVRMSQGGNKYLHKIQKWCCAELRWLVGHRGSRLTAKMQICPFCRTPIQYNNGQTVYPAKGKSACKLKGCSRVLDVEGKVHWVKPDGLPVNGKDFEVPNGTQPRP